MYYSAIGLISALVLIIVNQDILFYPKQSFDKPVWSIYRKFLIAVFVYYITDIIWGILDALKMRRLLFADTTVYFVAMSVGILLWAKFTVAYLEENNFIGRFIVYVGRFIAGMITILVIGNIFTPILFIVDENCVYIDYPVRDAMLLCQIFMFLITSIFAFTSMRGLDKENEKVQRYRILSVFGIIMASLLFIQLLFPLLPVYSIGFMLGTCMLHTFVTNEEKEEYKRRIEENQKVTVLKDTIVSLLNNMPGMAFTKDAETGEYLACNQAFIEYAHKKKSEEVIGLKDSDIFDPETAAHFVEADKIALSLSKPYIFFEDVPDAAGNQRQLQTTKLKYTDTSGRLCVLGMCQDITDMVSIQHEHAMTKEAYEQAVSSGLMYTNIAQTLARDYMDLYYVNADSEEFIEYQKSEDGSALSEVRRGWHFFSDCKKELSEKVYPDDRDNFLAAMNRKSLMKSLEQKNTFVITYRLTSDNGPVYVSMKISKMDDEQFIIIGIADVDAEMRETMAKNEALTEALVSAEQANRAKNTFLSGMSHELRTPLNAIIGLDALALKNSELSDETRSYLEKIGDSADNLLSMINDILDLSRIESGRVSLSKTTFLLGNLIEQINDKVMTLCTNKGLTYKCSFLTPVDISNIGDDSKLKEVLMTLLTNAIKYTEAPGNVTFTIEKVDEVEDQSTLRFVVKDTGVGIEEEYVSRLFHYSESDDEFGAQFGSSGLGLAITNKIVNMMNGTIDVKSELNVGTEVTVTIPLQINRQEDVDFERRLDLDTLYVLVVDDDPIEAEHAKAVLEEVGIRSDYCISGQEALRKIETQHVKHKPYNIVLMDWNMPGMNGREASAEIQRLYRGETTVVALTAYNWDDIREEAHQVGVNNSITKPLFVSSIIENFENIARRSNLHVFKEKNKANLNGRRILLAEDVEINAEILIDSLELENIKVDHVTNGEAAVEMFDKSTAGIYAAILMDVRMPVMDGLEAAKQIRAMSREDAKKIPIIALTANAFDEDVQRSIEAGMNAHLSKPIEIDNLLRILGELIYKAES